MKTINIVSVLMALMLSAAEFTAIDYLFTHSVSLHERHATAAPLWSGNERATERAA
jgi:hypothetical protein